jgi:hypothetical protein
MSKPTSVAPSPTSQQNFLHAHPSSHLHNDLDTGVRVTFTQSNSTGNHVINFSNSQKNSVEIHDGADNEAEQPLLNKSVSKLSS